MNDLTLVNNEFLRQFEIHIDDNLARIEYSEQERKIFLTKISIPDCIQNLEFEEAFIVKVLEFIEDKKMRVVPTSPKIASFVRKNRRYKELLPVGIKLLATIEHLIKPSSSISSKYTFLTLLTHFGFQGIRTLT